MNNFIQSYYSSTDNLSMPLHKSKENIDKFEYGYLTEDNRFSRHMSNIDIDGTDIFTQEDILTVFQSINQYDQPSKTNYTEKEIINSSICISLSADSLDSESKWNTLVSGSKDLQAKLNSEFNITTQLYRVGYNSIVLLTTDPVNSSSIRTQITQFISSNALQDTITVEELYKKQRQNSSLSVKEQYYIDSIKQYYKQIVDKLQDNSVNSIAQFLYNENHSKIGESRSKEIVQELKRIESLDRFNFAKTSPKINLLSQSLLQKYRTNWILNRDKFTITVLSKESLIPTSNSIVPNGLFIPYNLSESTEFNYFLKKVPADNSENTISISIQNSNKPILSTLLSQPINSSEITVPASKKYSLQSVNII